MLCSERPAREMRSSSRRHGANNISSPTPAGCDGEEEWRAGSGVSGNRKRKTASHADDQGGVRGEVMDDRAKAFPDRV